MIIDKMTYICLHGVRHTAAEFHAAISWATKRYPTRDLRPGECWIVLWRDGVAKRGAKGENGDRMD